MKKHFNLQLFEDGNGSGSGAGQGGSAGTGNGGQNNNAGNNGNHGTFSFEQAEEIANARAARAERSALTSYFQQQGLSETQIAQAIADYKAQQAAKAPNVDAITKERDDARAELALLKNGETLRKKGVREEFVKFVNTEIVALMKTDDKLDFEKAATKYLKDNPQYVSSGGSGYRVRTGTDGSGAGSASGTGTGTGQPGTQTSNDFINARIRGARRRN